jgi:hypothetical protein
LSSAGTPTETVREHLHLAFELVEKQQAILTPHWQKLEEQKTAIAQQQEEVERLSQTFSDRQNALQEAQNSLVQQTAQLQINTANLDTKQEYAQIIKEQLRNAEELYQQIHSLAATSNDVVLGQQADVEALEKKPLEELQKIVQDLQYKVEIDASFVHDQEQELKYKQEAIEELQTKINHASDHDHINLELELTDEKDLYQMLNSSLVGQRRNMLQHQKFLKQHQAVLLRRQGHTVVEEESNNQINLEPVLLQIETQRQQYSQQIQKLEREIEQIRSGIELNQGMIDNQTHDLDEKRQELKAIEENLLSLRRTTAEYCGRVNLYQEALQPIQDSLDGLRQKLLLIGESLDQFQETGDEQLQAIAQLRHTLQSLTSEPVLLAS